MTAHSIGWASIQATERIAAKAREVYPDEQEPATDRAALREKWIAAIKALRAGPGYLMDRPVPRITTEGA